MLMKETFQLLQHLLKICNMEKGIGFDLWTDYSFQEGTRNLLIGTVSRDF